MHVAATPAQKVVGRLRVEGVAVGPIARMFPAEQWLTPQNAGGGAVFGGRAGEVRENIGTEAESAHAPAGMFNLDAHVYDKETGYPVPYLDVRVDVLRGETPVLSDLPLVPVARPHKGVAGLHYGNNVALEPVGTYRVMVHIAPSALTGTEQPETAEFTLGF